MSFDHIRGEGHTAAGREWNLQQRVNEAKTYGLVPIQWECDAQGNAYACLLGPEELFPEHTKEVHKTQA